jgi:hypothetical protein
MSFEQTGHSHPKQTSHQEVAPAKGATELAHQQTQQLNP